MLLFVAEMLAIVTLAEPGAPTRMGIKIGLRDVAAMPPNSIIWDDQIKGFCVRRQFSELVTFSVVYRTRDGVQRWHKIGRWPVFTPHLAKQEAIKILRSVALGEDPSAERQAMRNAMTVAQLCAAYMADIESGKLNGKKLSTIRSDKSRIKHHIAPKLGKLKVVSITQDQVEIFMNSLTPGSANRTVGLLSAMFLYAVKKKLRPSNPCHGIKLSPEAKKTRRLSDTEYGQLSNALFRINKTAASVIKLLAITGWRSSEVKNLRWSELDLERKVATLGETKTGVSIRPLSGAAVEFIKQQPQTSQFVFEHQHRKPLLDIRPHWLKLRMLRDVTPHTLRHSFASLAGDMGLSDSTIAGLLGHSRSSITSRYIHLDKALIAAADIVADETLRLMRL
jgi:integrase